MLIFALAINRMCVCVCVKGVRVFHSAQGCEREDGSHGRDVHQPAQEYARPVSFSLGTGQHWPIQSGLSGSLVAHPPVLLILLEKKIQPEKLSPLESNTLILSCVV